MAPETIRRLAALSNQLIESLVTAAICAEEIRSEVQAVCNNSPHSLSAIGVSSALPSDLSIRLRPLLDESTLTVSWNGHSVHLGNTVTFRLMARLARRPNQYVTHLDLIGDVWDNEDVEVTTIRSAVRRLRQKLRDGGVDVLADAIRGHNGRYTRAVRRERKRCK